MTAEQFLQWLEEDINDGKNLLRSAKSDEERTHVASAISTLYDVKEKFLTIEFTSQPIETQPH